MTKISYNTSENWDSTGFTVKANWASGRTTDITNEANWTFSPATPSDISTTSVLCTATYGEYSISSDAQTVLVKQKENLGGLTEGRYFLIVGGHVLKASTFAVKNADAYTTSNSETTSLNETDAWYFASVGDDKWTIRTSQAEDASYLYATNTNNGLVSGKTEDSWKVIEGSSSSSYSGKLLLKDTNQSRYLSYTTTSDSYVRTYTNTNNGDCEVLFIKYVAPAFSITGAPTKNVEIGSIGELGVSIENLNVTWSTSDASIIKMDDNMYEAVGGGIATITASDASGNNATCQIIVNYGEITIAQANSLCSELSSGNTSAYKITLKDTYITKIETTQKIYLSDAKLESSGSNSILMFDYNDLEDLSKYALLNGRVTVTGNLMNFRGTTYEITNPEFTYTDTAIEFAQTFNDAVSSICTEAKQSNDNSSELAEIWDTLELYYDDVETTYAKTKLKGATAEDTNADIAKMIGLYDHIVKRYGSKLGDNYNFIGRTVSSSSLSNLIYRTNSNNTTIVIVVLVSFVSLTAIGGYFFAQKRRFN